MTIAFAGFLSCFKSQTETGCKQPAWIWDLMLGTDFTFRKRRRKLKLLRRLLHPSQQFRLILGGCLRRCQKPPHAVAHPRQAPARCALLNGIHKGRQACDGEIAHIQHIHSRLMPSTFISPPALWLACTLISFSMLNTPLNSWSCGSITKKFFAFHNL